MDKNRGRQNASLLAALNSALILLENLAVLIAAIALVAAVLLVAINALSRHLFSLPLEFQLELTEAYLLVMLISLALPWSFRNGGFIRITIFSELFNTHIWNYLFKLGLLASSFYLGILGLEAFVIFKDAWVKNHLIMGVIDWPVAWSWIWIPIGCWLLSARLVLMALNVGPQPRGH